MVDSRVVRRSFIILCVILGTSGSILNWLSGISAIPYEKEHIGVWDIGFLCFVSIFITIPVSYLIDRTIITISMTLPEQNRTKFMRANIFTWFLACLPVVGMYGYSFVSEIGIVFLFLVLNLIFYIFFSTKTSVKGIFASKVFIVFLFFISGFSALIYQVVWQRKLYMIYGTNIESITMIVTIFMFGLGIGSLFGGYLSKRFPEKGHILFMICEFGIGLFGLISLSLIEWIGAMTLEGTLFEVSLTVFGFLFVPTLLMGATLPILVAHINRNIRNVGKSVGILYCINTVGSALASVMTADVLFVWTGLRGATIVAVICNFSVGLLVLLSSRKAEIQEELFEQQIVASTYSSPTVLLLSLASGFISLSQEIVWMRLISYMSGGKPQVFAHVLGFLLCGMAFGAYLGGRECDQGFRRFKNPILFVSSMFIISGVVYYLSISIITKIHLLSWPSAHVTAYIAIFVCAFTLGGIFPVLCHIYKAKDVGGLVSKTYMANIIGSTAGPLITGFLLFEYLSTSDLILGLSLLSLSIGVVGWFAQHYKRYLGLAVLGVFACVSMVIHRYIFDNLFANLRFISPIKSYHHIYEDRSGVVATTKEKVGGDGIYGGGVYDGRMNIDPIINSNWIDRAYLIPTLHPNPKHVLVIGLSGGSWVRVLADYDGIEKITVVEISKTYINLISHYPIQQSVLSDPKVTIYFDDGRRYLLRTNNKFDLIVQNTTYHWRSNSTYILSKEYFSLCKDHLKEGGAIWVNTTDSVEVSATLASVFTHIVTFKNFVGGSDYQFVVDKKAREVALKRYPVFQEPLSDKKLEVLDYLSKVTIVDIGDSLRNRDIPIITDDNMWVEYKKDRWWSSKKRWTNIF